VKLWHRLDLDIEDAISIDVEDYLLFSKSSKKYNSFWVPEAGGIWSIPPHEIFKKEWVQYMEGTYGAVCATAQMFVRQPYYQHAQAHIDTYLDGAVIQEGAVNWMINQDDDAEHCFYAHPTDGEPILQKRSEIDIDLSWPMEGLELLDSLVIGTQPTLVNTGHLHNIKMKSARRTCLSLRFNGIVSWSQHLEHFKDIII
jgi:hypothetical protein